MSDQLYLSFILAFLVDIFPVLIIVEENLVLFLPSCCVCVVQEKWHTLIAEHKTDVLEWVACVNKDKLVLCYLQDVKVSLLHKIGDHFLLNVKIPAVSRYFIAGLDFGGAFPVPLWMLLLNIFYVNNT